MEQYQGGFQSHNEQQPQGGFQQPPYQQYQPQYQPPQQPQQPQDPFKGKAIASMVLGIISLVFFWSGVGALISMICGLIGVILGAQARKGAQNMGIKPNGMATAGLICGLIGAIVSLIGLITCIACLSFSGSAINQFGNDLEGLAELIEESIYY